MQEKVKFSLWDLGILILCVYVLIALAVEMFYDLPAEISTLLGYFDTFICLIFLGDFLFNFFTAKNKAAYLKWGWIDLISSIPHFKILKIFRWARIARVLKVMHLIRGLDSFKSLVPMLFKSRAKGTFASVSFLGLLLIICSAIVILQIESSHPDSNIRTAGDALWWSIVTVTTVGYGDYAPVTNVGRIVASVLMILGIGLFGIFTAFVASWFVGDTHRVEIVERIENLEKKLTE